MILAASLLTMAGGAYEPKFGDFPVHQVFKGKPAEPQFRPGEDEHPNGVGHFRGGVTFYAERGPTSPDITHWPGGPVVPAAAARLSSIL